MQTRTTGLQCLSDFFVVEQPHWGDIGFGLGLVAPRGRVQEHARRGWGLDHEECVGAHGRGTAVGAGDRADGGGFDYDGRLLVRIFPLTSLNSSLSG